MNLRLNTIFIYWNKFFPTVGQLAIATFLMALFSGIGLAIPYDVRSPFESLQIIHLTNKSGALFRGLHFWSGQLFLIFSFFHIWEHMESSNERKVGHGKWIRITLSIPCILGVMLLGFILKGDSEGMLAHRILSGLLKTLPLIGDELRFAIVGMEGDFQILYIHHAVTTTVAILIVMVEHTRRIWATTPATVQGFSFCIILTFLAMPGLHDGADPLIKGPWYFLGLQEVLHWTTYPVLIVYGCILLLLIFYLTQLIAEKKSNYLKTGLALTCLFYTGFLIMGWLFRGENWQFIMPWQ